MLRVRASFVFSVVWSLKHLLMLGVVCSVFSDSDLSESNTVCFCWILMGFFACFFFSALRSECYFCVNVWLLTCHHVTSDLIFMEPLSQTLCQPVHHHDCSNPQNQILWPFNYLIRESCEMYSNILHCTGCTICFLTLMACRGLFVYKLRVLLIEIKQFCVVI